MHCAPKCAYCAIECNTLFAQCNYIFIEYFRNRSRLTFRVQPYTTHTQLCIRFFFPRLSSHIIYCVFAFTGRCRRCHRSMEIVVRSINLPIDTISTECAPVRSRNWMNKNWSKPGSFALDRNTIAWTRRSSLRTRLFSHIVAKQQKRLNCIVRLSRLWYFDYLLLLFLPFRFPHFSFSSVFAFCSMQRCNVIFVSQILYGFYRNSRTTTTSNVKCTQRKWFDCLWW